MQKIHYIAEDGIPIRYKDKSYDTAYLFTFFKDRKDNLDSYLLSEKDKKEKMEMYARNLIFVMEEVRYDIHVHEIMGGYGSIAELFQNYPEKRILSNIFLKWRSNGMFDTEIFLYMRSITFETLLAMYI